jgi:hypothetical protein
VNFCDIRISRNVQHSVHHRGPDDLQEGDDAAQGGRQDAEAGADVFLGEDPTLQQLHLLATVLRPSGSPGLAQVVANRPPVLHGKDDLLLPLSPLHPLPLQALPVGVQGDRLQRVAPGPETVPGDLFAQVGGVRDGSGAERTALFVFLFAVQHARAQRVGLPDSLLVLHNLFERQLGLFRAEKEQ